MYSNSLDLQNTLGLGTLIALSNDDPSASAPPLSSTNISTSVVTAKIAEGDALINAKLAQRYTVPLTTALTGTVSATTTAMTGTGTLFTTELAVNDVIVGTDGQSIVVVGITSNLAATLAVAPSTPWSGMTVSRIPALIHYCSITLAGFYLWQRRSTEVVMPADWLTRYNRVMGVAGMEGLLDALANGTLVLDNYTSVYSSESQISNTNDSINLDFSNDNSPVRNF